MQNTSVTEIQKTMTTTTPGDAYFIVQGTPQKVSESDRQTASKLSTNPLLQFDLKFDSLKAFLDNVATVVNQHASILNKIQIDITQKIYKENISETLKKIAGKAKLNDQDLFKIFNNMIDKPLLEGSGDAYEDATNTFCNRLEAMNNGFIFLNKKVKDVTESVRKTNENLAKKVDHTEYKEKVKKNKKKLKELIANTASGLDAKILELEKKLATKFNEMNGKVQEIEKNTLWKIKDCEDLLKSRVSERYVNDAIEKIQENLQSEIRRLHDGHGEKIDLLSRETMKRILEHESSVEEKISSLRKSLKEVTESNYKKLDLHVFEEFRNLINLKTDRTDEKLTTITKKYDPMLDKINYELRHLGEKVARVDQRITDVNISIENYILKGVSPDQMKQDNEEKKKTSDKDSNKDQAEDTAKRMAEMEQYFSKYKDDIAMCRNLLLQVQEELNRKVDLGMYNLGLGKKLDKEEFIKELNTRALDDERLKKALEKTDEMSLKVEKMNENMEKKMARFKKELDVTTLLKAIKSKAEDEHVQKGFSNVDQKISAISDALSLLKSEIETAQSSIKSVNTQIYRFSDNAFLSTRQVAQQCLSCGNNVSQPLPTGQVKGNDGKLYKADFRTQEVIEISSTKKESLSKSLIYEETSMFSTQSPRIKAKGIDRSGRPNTASLMRGRNSNTQVVNNLSPVPQPSQNLSRGLRPLSAKK